VDGPAVARHGVERSRQGDAGRAEERQRELAAQPGSPDGGALAPSEPPGEEYPADDGDIPESEY